MSLTIKIAGIDRTKQIDWHSYQLINVLSREIDTLEFDLKVHSGKVYKPALAQEVEVFEGGVKIYGGYIIEILRKVEAMKEVWHIICKDYHYGLDRKLVYKSYFDKHAGTIVKDIIQTFTSGFTAFNVELGPRINSIRFNYENVSRAIQQVADRINYDWYVDQNRNLHFFSKESHIAPFKLDDTSGNFIWNSLNVTQHISQIKNQVFVQGGIQILGPKVFKYRGDGVTRSFSTVYEMTDLTVKKGGVVQTIGKDGVDDPAIVDVLYNPSKYVIIFREDNKPASGVEVEISGNASMPVFVQVGDYESIKKYGVFQFRIIDKSIVSQFEARQRALAELEKYKRETGEVTFRTRKDGLKVGQKILLSSSILGITKYFTINRIISRIEEPVSNKKLYEVSLIGSEQIGVIEVLKDLLLDQPAKNIEIAQYEILYRYFSIAPDFFRIKDISLVTSKTSPPYRWGDAGVVNALRWNKGTWVA